MVVRVMDVNINVPGCTGAKAAIAASGWSFVGRWAVVVVHGEVGVTNRGVRTRRFRPWLDHIIVAHLWTRPMRFRSGFLATQLCHHWYIQNVRESIVLEQCSNDVAAKAHICERTEKSNQKYSHQRYPGTLTILFCVLSDDLLSFQLESAHRHLQCIRIDRIG